jgi:hypothetical protein
LSELSAQREHDRIFIEANWIDGEACREECDTNPSQR